MIAKMLQAARIAKANDWWPRRNEYECQCSPDRIIALCEFVATFDKWEQATPLSANEAHSWDALMAARRRLDDD